MPKKRPTPPAVIRLIYELQHQQEARRLDVNGQALDAHLQRLRDWQSLRLRRTYADLLDDPMYRQACEFFLSDIYASKDFSQRDQDAERLYEVFSRYLPDSMLTLLADTIELNHLTNRLDRALSTALAEGLGVTGEITPQDYAAGYRLCDNYAERNYQIERLVAVMNEAAAGARGPIFAISLRLAKAPAHRLGWSELYDFLERGYRACRPMRQVSPFTGAIRERELRILDRIFAGHPQPFE